MASWFTAKGADTGQGIGAGLGTALGTLAKDSFAAPHALIVELTALLSTGVVNKAVGKSELTPEAKKRVEAIIKVLEEKRKQNELNDKEEQAISVLLDFPEDADKWIAQAAALKDYVRQNWGDGWKFIFKQLEVFKAHMMGQQGDSLITSMTGKTVEALKVGFVGTPSPLLAEARESLSQLLPPTSSQDPEPAKKALAALLDNLREAFSGKELSLKDKALLHGLRQKLEQEAEIPYETLIREIEKGVALVEKYMGEIRETALIPTMVQSLFESLQKKVNGHDKEEAIPQPALPGTKKPLTYGAAFQGYIETILGSLGHSFDRQVALRYARMILSSLEYAEKSTNGNGEIKRLIETAKGSIQVSMAELETAPQGIPIKDLTSKMTKECRESLGSLQIYLNSFKLPIYTVERLDVSPEQLLYVEEPPLPEEPHATDADIEAAVDTFIDRTIRFVRGKFGRKPFDAFYIRGFTRKLMEFVNTYVQTNGENRYFEKRKEIALSGDRFFRVLKNAIDEAKKSSEPFEIALAKELLKPENNQGLTPDQIYDQFMVWVVDRFAPQHEWCKEVRDAFRAVRFAPISRLQGLNIPLAILTTAMSWALTPFVFIGQMVANWASPWLLKKIARKTKLLPTLIATAEESMGFRAEYQYTKDKALYTQLSKLWKAMKRSKGDGEEIHVSEEMRAKLQDLASDLLSTLDAHFKRLGAASTQYIPEEWIDALAKKEAIEGLVKGLALALNVQFEQENLKDQTLQTLQLLTSCYENSPAVSMDEKRQMEKQLQGLIQKIVYFSISKAIQENLNPTASYQKEAAAWIDDLKRDAEAMIAKVREDGENREKIERILLSFLGNQYDRVLELKRNAQIDLSTREMLGNLAGEGAVQIHTLLDKINKKEEINTQIDEVNRWANGLKKVPFLNIKVFNTDPFIDMVTRIAYARYKPVVEGLMQLTRQSSVVEGLIRQVVMLPVVGKK